MQLPIFKYSSCGNNFVILDETQREYISEEEKRSFSYYATNQNFGVGSDNFLVIQKCCQPVLEKINTEYHYWNEIPNPNAAHYVFRMFESDGSEAYSCGNGLMSIARHLFNNHHIETAKIITEIPTPSPTTIQIGTDQTQEMNWAHMAPPRRVPEVMVDPLIRKPLCDTVDCIEELKVTNVRQSDKMRFFFNHSVLNLKGYLVFTGEPHLVIFAHDGLIPKEVSRLLFLQKSQIEKHSEPVEKRFSGSSEFVNFIGKYFVREYSEQFPVGVNINFVQISDDGKSLDHRCFERGINHETLACGTGSLASAVVANELKLIESDRVEIRPHRCCWTNSEAKLIVEKIDGDWMLKGHPKLIFEGHFNFG